MIKGISGHKDIYEDINIVKIKYNLVLSDIIQKIISDILSQKIIKEEYQKIYSVYKNYSDELKNKYNEIYLSKVKGFMKEDKNYLVSISSDFMMGENGILERLIKE